MATGQQVEQARTFARRPNISAQAIPLGRRSSAKPVPRPVASPRAHGELDRLRRALDTVAQLVLDDPVYAPLFVRLEKEIAIEEARLSNDVLERARAVARQKAIGAN